jgi:D-3-phosphoglycerate dehydrogenase
MELKSLFIDCNDQLAPVWKRVVRAEDPPIDVNRAAFAPAELSRLLNGYDICIDDHSYLPTALVERCDRLKHIVFLGTGAGSYMNVVSWRSAAFASTPSRATATPPLPCTRSR